MLTKMVSISWPRDPPSSASQSAGITGVSHHTWLVCQCFIEDFHINIHQGYWPEIFLFSCVSVKFWYRDDAGLRKWVREDSLFLLFGIISEGMVPVSLCTSGRIRLWNWIRLVLDSFLVGRLLIAASISGLTIGLFRDSVSSNGHPFCWC